jgi:cytoskeletal protein CcmA (bactofilin family)
MPSIITFCSCAQNLAKARRHDANLGVNCALTIKLSHDKMQNDAINLTRDVSGATLMFFNNRKTDTTRNSVYAAPIEPQHAAEPSFIAHDLVVTGNISTHGELHINGTVTGHVAAQVCVVDVNGRVDGEIRANAIFVQGTVNGPLSASHVHVYPGGRVRGDITHETITIENGADVLGQFKRHTTEVRQAQAPARQQDAHQPDMQHAPRSSAFAPPAPALVTTPPAQSAQAAPHSIFDDFFGTEEQAADDSSYAPIKVVKANRR